jgi:RNase P subunit RPR2
MEPIIKLNKNATDILVFECLECGREMYIENGIDSLKCYKCDGMIIPIRKARMPMPL